MRSTLPLSLLHLGCAGAVTTTPAVPAMTASNDAACFAMPVPFSKPAVDSVVDSAAVVAALSAPGVIVTDSSIIALHFGPTGNVLRTLSISGPLNATGITTYARKRPSRGVWGVRMVVTSAGGPRLSLTPSRYCPPRPQPQPGPLIVRDEVMRADEAARLPAVGPYRVNFLVNEAGLPIQIVLPQTTGNDRLDAMALEAARSARFVPAELDGVRVPAWFDR